MKSAFVFCIAILLCYNFCSATIRRVGYPGVPVAGLDYADIASAQAASLAGDTIQIYGTIITPTTINKRLVIIGFGYNLDANPDLQVNGSESPSFFQNIITFDVGSENSIIEGCYFKHYFDISTSNITVRRCFLNHNTGTLNNHITLRNDLRAINNTKIESCVASINMYSSSANPCLNTLVVNCILDEVVFAMVESTGSIINCVSVSPSYSVNWNLNNATFLVKNCIGRLFSNYTNSLFENNFFAYAQPAIPPQGGNNRWNQNWGDIFNRLGGSNDAAGESTNSTFNENYYLLKPGSPAINGGFDSNNNPTDCGIFGGDAATVYRTGGIPTVPSVYKLSAPAGRAATSNPYNVNISVKSNN